MKNVIVISAHPDDEILGVGGTLLKHKKKGDAIAWIIVTSMKEEQGFSLEQIARREKEIREVSEMVGFSNVYRLDYPAMTLSSSSVNGMVPKLASLFTEFRPEVIYVMNRSDAHSDHRYTFDSVMSCTKSFRYPFIKNILMYECLSETEFAPQLHEKIFIPNYFVDISEFLPRKLEIMKVYKSEIGEHPFPRSLRNIEALAVFRGATAGAFYAEAFQLLKFVDK
tara:strand:- start:243 stop:914 length:672 start_codon:yes stop_codon:yes gene_type:complete